MPDGTSLLMTVLEARCFRLGYASSQSGHVVALLPDGLLNRVRIFALGPYCYSVDFSPPS